MTATEINFDGLVGPTHNYAGLSWGNVASQRHKASVSHPRQAALEGLAKMKLLADLGVVQAVLPPHDRPDVAALRRLGFTGSDAEVLARAGREAPPLLAACASASAMWAANAATVSPSADAADGCVHFTPANLAHNLHRALEPPTTAALLRAIFPDAAAFAHHDPLPAGPTFSDEGAANHLRFAAPAGEPARPGVEVFVYGRGARDERASLPQRYPARATLEAAQAIARLHQLDPRRTLFVRQNPAAIDAGAFHNDVVAVSNLNVLFCHAQAWVDQPAVLGTLRRAVAETCGAELIVLEVRPDEVTLADAVDTYLFNSQLVSVPDGTMALICPRECEDHPAAREYLDGLLHGRDHPIRRVEYVEVRQSMRNGGGPACLRLRVPLTEAQRTRALPGVFLTPALYERLITWVGRHYREELRPEDLADPALLAESRAALDELTHILGLPAVYPFQRQGT